MSIEIKACVKLLGLFGDESDIVNSAGNSTDRYPCKGIEHFRLKDEVLLKKLLTHRHKTPFEMVVTRWEIYAPIFVLRQIMRHRMASWSENSARYMVKYNAPYASLPPSDVLDGAGIKEYDKLMQQCFDFYRTHYEAYLKRNPSKQQCTRAREVLRYALPVSMMSNVVLTLNLSSLMNFFALRTSKHAQFETQELANSMLRILGEQLPIWHMLWAGDKTW